MNARNEALLEQAKQQGYLVMRYGYNKTLKAKYFKWCESQKIPAIYVWFHGQSATFESNTEPVSLGYINSDADLLSSPTFDPTPELEARLVALSEKCLDSVSSRNQSKVNPWPWSGEGTRYVSQEMAIEAAKELWDIWQEAKKHLVFLPDDDK